MRLWTLHPEYLDRRGLVALWREGLLAQAVLLGLTKGYTRHPQLARFRAAPSPEAAIAAYLRAVQQEATRRGYAFDARRIVREEDVEPLPVPEGQLDYEWAHLARKLQDRDPAWLEGLRRPPPLRPHPLFRVVPGGIAEWEVVHPPAARRQDIP